MTRRVGIIGAGPGGICAAIEVRRLGLGDVTVFEKAPGVGGVWHHNTYPGAACDVPSFLYSFSFAPKCDWTRPYASQPEIKAYLERVVDDFDLAPVLRLGTAVTRAHWDELTNTWHVTTDRGESHDFDVLIGAVGMFGRPMYPDIPGLESFAGHAFHSARWDHDYSLEGRHVAVIGSAASAVQFIPEIAPRVAQLYVFQRSPNWVLPKGDTPYTPEQLAEFATNPEAIESERRTVYDRLDLALTFANKEINAISEQMGRDNIAVVTDPDLRRRLTPNYPFGCKRPLLSNNYYPTFNRSNVELVTDAIARVAPGGVETVDGTMRAVDSIILATGFDTTKYLSTVDVYGRGGLTLADAWTEGAHAYLGITTTGFPNLFQLYGPNTNNGSILFMLECQVAYITRHLQRMDHDVLAAIDVLPATMDEYNRALQDDLDHVEVWNAACNGYYRVPSGRIVTQWPHSMTEYRRRTTCDDRAAYQTVPA